MTELPKNHRLINKGHIHKNDKIYKNNKWTNASLYGYEGCSLNDDFFRDRVCRTIPKYKTIKLKDWKNARTTKDNMENRNRNTTKHTNSRRLG